MKTNATRVLEKLNIPFSVSEYKYDDNHIDALSVAKEIGVSPDIIYKTICMLSSSNKLYVFVTPSEFTISLKKARELTGEKDIALLKHDLLQKYTGYIKGGCSPLAMIKPYPTFIENLALLEDKIYISAGLRGAQIIIAPCDLQRATCATFADFT